MAKQGEKVLPKILKLYENSDFDIRERAIFFYNLIIIMSFSMIVVISSTAMVQLLGPDFGYFYFPVLLCEAIILMIYLLCLFLLIKGKFRFATHLLLVTSIIAIWTIMFLDKSSAIVRFDSIVYLFGVLSILPLLIHRGRKAIHIYAAANVLLLIAFILIAGNQTGLPASVRIEYFLDVLVSSTFLIIVGYNIFNINKRANERTIIDINERHAAEKALLESEKKYNETIELLPQTIYEADIKGNLIYVNANGFNSFGYNPEDLLGGINLIEMVHESSRESVRRNILKLLNDDLENGNIYTALRKNGSTFPVQIYSGVKKVNDQVTGFRGIIVDISERIRAESEMKKSEERYRTLFENAQIGIYQTTPEGEILNVNPAILKMLGYDSLDDIKKLNLESGHDYTDYGRPKFKSMIEKNGVIHNFESQWRKKNGELIDIIENSQTVMNPDGKIIYYDGFVENITDRKKAEKALIESQQQFQILSEMSPVGIFRTSKEGLTTYVNPKWSEISGLMMDEASGNGWINAVHPEDREMLVSNWKKDMSSGEKSNSEYRFIKPDGSISWVLGNAVPEIVDGEVKGYIGTITNITEIKNTQSLLENSEKRFRDLADLLPQTVWEATIDGSLTYINNQGLLIYGYSTDDVAKGMNLLDFVIPQEREKVLSSIHINLSKENSDVFSDEFTAIRKDGSTFPIRPYYALIFENRKPVGFRGVTFDLSDIKQAEYELKESENRYRSKLELLVVERTEELETANEELVEINNALTDQHQKLEVTLENLKQAQNQLIQSEKMASLGILAAGVAHEINNPLNFIMGGVIAIESYLKENFEDKLPEIEPLLESMNEGVQRASTIVTSLNHYTRYDEVPMTSCNIHLIIDNCLIMLQGNTRNRITVNKEYTSKEYELVCNEGRMHQAFLNILANAVQSIRDEGNISITTSLSGEKLEISISDDGCGINEENMARIFDPFFTTKEPGSGTGLGLSITYNIINEHNGSIICNSRLNKGTEFIITLPAKY